MLHEFSPIPTLTPCKHRKSTLSCGEKWGQVTDDSVAMGPGSHSPRVVIKLVPLSAKCSGVKNKLYDHLMFKGTNFKPEHSNTKSGLNQLRICSYWMDAEQKLYFPFEWRNET